MPTWTDGYVADIAYTSEFYSEISPGWLATAATLLGHRAPDLAGPFRWAELGCGQGVSANVFAATNPRAEFHGFDFNPAHIESARRLATSAGLRNAHFHEMSFGEIAAAPDGRIPQFDFIVAHGIWSWVSPAVRDQLVAAVGRHLAPGGLLYVSYNNLVGWNAMLPVQRLIREWARTRPGTSLEKARDGFAFARGLAKSGAAFFAANPTAATRLENAQTAAPRYIAHEYMHDNWEPSLFHEVAEALDSAKLSFIGSATLVENVDAISLPADTIKMIAEVADPRLRETVRDFASNRAFRRDIYRRGSERMPTGEHRERLDAMLLVAATRAGEKEIKIATGIGNFGLRGELHGQIRDRLAQGPMSFRDLTLLPGLARQPLAEALQAFIFLVAGGVAHPAPAPAPDPAAVAAARALNAAIARHNAMGGEISALAAPAIASGFRADMPETATVAALLEGVASADAIAGSIVAHLERAGRQVVKDGKAIQDRAAAVAEMTATVNRLLAERAPLWKRLGAVPAG
jgi:SAM-dependent methyltransferase